MTAGTRALATDLSRALDPVNLCDVIGLVPDPWQETLLRSDAREVSLNCARQSGKSTLTAVLAAHRAIYYPGSLIVIGSPSQRQSGEQLKRVRAVLRPVTALSSESAIEISLPNGSRILSLPSNPDTIRGLSSVNLLLLDEAAWIDDEFMTAVRPMVGVSKGRVVSLSTPGGLRGWWYSAWERADPAILRIRITADDCPRLTPEFLARERNILGSYRFEAEYMGVFRESSTSLFAEHDIQAAFKNELKVLDPFAKEDD